jgi:chitodextrinase
MLPRNLAIGAALFLAPVALLQFDRSIPGPGALHAQTPPAAPASYQDLYSATKAQIDAFASQVPAHGTYPTDFSAELMTANSARGSALLAQSRTGLLMELDSLQAMGLKAVTVGIHFPILYSGFYQNPSDYQQYVNYYTQLAQDVRARGLKLIVETGIVLNEPGLNSVDCSAFYRSLTLDQYQRGRMQVAVTIAQNLNPDYLSVVNEPDNEAAQSGFTALGTVNGSLGLLNTILSGLHQAGLNGLKVGAGVGTWLAGYDQFVRGYAATGIQYIDMHVFPLNNDFLTKAFTISSIANTAGKLLAISQCWPLKERNSELATLSFPQAESRDPFSFWEPLDIGFLQAMVSFARSNEMAFFSPFYSTYFHGYIDYNPAVSPSASVSQIQAAVGSQAIQNLTAGQYSPTGLAYARAILDTPDTVKPSVPSGLSVAVSASAVKLTWNPATDNIGVAGYAIYRNAHQIGTTISSPYFDLNLPPATSYSYTVAAFDTAGNISAVSKLVAAKTPAPSDKIPPSAPAGLAAQAAPNGAIRLSWNPSSDNVHTAGYQIYRGSSANSLTLLAASPANSYIDSTATPSSTYYYSVVAYDDSGNVSQRSPVTSARRP